MQSQIQLSLVNNPVLLAGLSQFFDYMILKLYG